MVFDNPPSCETIPDAVKSEGHKVLELKEIEPGVWKILIKKCSK